MLAYVIAIPLIVHGVAHLSGVLAPWSLQMQGYSNASWVLSRRAALCSPVGRLYGVVWLAASTSLVTAGLALLLHQAEWSTLAAFGCALSLAAIATWWRSVPPGAKGGALFDVLLLALLLSPLQGPVLQLLK
jgi:hypothetical protein